MRVLDIGAGTTPDIRATHAIEKEKRRSKWLKQGQKFCVDQLKPVGLTDFDRAAMRGMWSEIEYKYGVNFNKDRFPYPDNYFDMVVSSNALLRPLTGGSLNAFREAHRVVKVGGKIEVKFAGSDTKEGLKKHLNFITQSLRLVGFHNIQQGRSKYSSGYYPIFSNVSFDTLGYVVSGTK